MINLLGPRRNRRGFFLLPGVSARHLRVNRRAGGDGAAGDEGIALDAYWASGTDSHLVICITRRRGGNLPPVLALSKSRVPLTGSKIAPTTLDVCAVFRIGDCRVPPLKRGRGVYRRVRDAPQGHFFALLRAPRATGAIVESFYKLSICRLRGSIFLLRKIDISLTRFDMT